MEIVVTASFITAFIAGMAALFAPCCIGVLLPSYLGSVFKSKTKIFLMTFVYYLGLLTIFMPLGLGVAGLSSFFSRYHSIFFTLGGTFMLLMGATLLLGKSIMLPMKKVHPKLKKYDLGSIYVLGIFSGIATTCCAPVLAGVLALSAMPGSLWLGGLYSLTFVTGMVIPLFLMAGLVDKTNVSERFRSLRRRISYQLAGHQVNLSLSHLISGLIFVAFGLFILLFERSSPETMGSSFQIEINLFAARITRNVANFFHIVPQWAWALVFSALFIAIAWKAYRQASGTENKEDKK
ncbi:MAG: cytochrome c biogenesis CcdA family protein [bacterium]|nr:cytochrome c biogenesis CcdA family protein [bacterium]